MLSGFGISGFRSFGREFVRIDNLKKVNILIGSNNSGKSNVLRFCKHLSSMLNKKPYVGFNELDYNLVDSVKDIKYSIKLEAGNILFNDIYNQIKNMLDPVENHFSEWKNHVWLEYNAKFLGEGDSNESLKSLFDKIYGSYNEQQSNKIASKFLGYTGGDHRKRCMDITKKILGFGLPSFEVYFVEAFRRITYKSETDLVNSISGNGLIQKLRSIQSPELAKYSENKEKFTIINNYIKEILSEPSAYLEIPAEKDEIYVSIKNKILPIESLGTGIHELIILASAVTIIDNVVFCIEEPEIHIHPTLQKKFIRYLLEKTNNQYLITSHSNSFFDIDGLNLYHCYLENGYTNCKLVSNDNEKLNIINELGYKLSDLLLSNYIIWVEGPSDRIYLNHWLTNKEPRLKEGLHYTVMFYGGRLLNHLSYDDEDFQNFIRLSRIKHESAIIIDSDKKNKQAHLNDTKNRIKEEFLANKQFVWVTKGKEIENYIGEDAYNDAISKIHPQKYSKKIPCSQYANITKLNSGFVIDKIAVAKHLSKVSPDYSVLDLNINIDRLIKFIVNAN
ncbi:MAG: AAA family ATPase [bacterium]